MPKGIFESSFRKYNKQVMRLSRGLANEIDRSWTKQEMIDEFYLSPKKFPYIMGKARQWLWKNHRVKFYCLNDKLTYKVLGNDNEKRQVAVKKIRLLATNCEIVFEIDSTSAFQLIGSAPLIAAKQSVGLLENKLEENKDYANITNTNRKS